MDEISVGDARRLALAAQGFADPRPTGRVDARRVRRTVDRLGVLQVDSVNVLCRSHYLPVFSRLGSYPRRLLDRGPYFEYWGHRASLLPLTMHPLFRWRMEAGSKHVFGADLTQWRTVLDSALWEAPWAVLEGMTRLSKEQPGLVDKVLAVVTEQGPVTGKMGPAVSRGPADEGGRMWNWHDAKIALEWLFFCGKVSIAGRLPSFERLYDLTERVLPAEVLALPTPAREDAQRELTRISARSLGIATARELQRYFHLPPPESRMRIAELTDSGELAPVRVDGKRMYVWPAAPPRDVQARTLLSPFDPLIWERDRTLRLFGFHYRIGLYTPAAKRTHGYYALPFLLDDRLVGWVDLKADRSRSVLRVQSAHAEDGVDTAEVAAALTPELDLMADWLELETVSRFSL